MSLPNRLSGLFRYLIFVFALIPAFHLSAQELVVESMTETADVMVVGNQKTDNNGEICAIVRVMLPVEGCEFAGNVIAVVPKTGEYWVYLPPRDKFLEIRTPRTYPTLVRFNDHGIKALESKRFYNLKVRLPEQSGQAPAAKQQLTITVTPANAMVIVDSYPHEPVNGIVNLTLPVGDHEYVIAAHGYQSAEGSVRLKATAPGRLRVDLDPAGSDAPAPVASTPAPTPAVQQPVTQPAVETFTVNGVTFEMVKVEGGTYMMGANDGWGNEKPVHSETVGTFYIGKTEVTQRLWAAVMGSNPSKVRGENLPVENVSWYDCQEFVERLSRLTGRIFRLPTEAEWEYAARGGNRSRGYKYSGSNDIDRVGWYSENSGNTTHPVGQKLDNELGIFDMSGNVWEWCSDKMSDNYSSPRNSSYRVVRGGSWAESSSRCRSVCRGWSDPSGRYGSEGLRLAL